MPTGVAAVSFARDVHSAAVIGKKFHFFGESLDSVEGRISPRKPQEAPGDPRTPQDAPRKLQEAPGGPRRPKAKIKAMARARLRLRFIKV